MCLVFFSDIVSESETNVFSQSTTASNWSDVQKSVREKYNDAMHVLSNGLSEDLGSQVNQPFKDLHYSTRSYYVRHAKAAFELICNIIAPGQSEQLIDEVIDKYRSQTTSGEDSMTSTIIEAYKRATDHTTRTQILYLLANKYSKASLLIMIEGVTVHRIDVARKHAETHWPGEYIAPPKVVRVRISKGGIPHFVEFISAPMYWHTVGFGSKHLRL